MKRKHKFVVTTKAIINILDAFEYYEFSQPGLGDSFLEYLELSYRSIDNNPEIYKVIFKNFRQAKVNKFPYVIIYGIEQGEIIITKVFNTYQNPIKKIR